MSDRYERISVAMWFWATLVAGAYVVKATVDGNGAGDFLWWFSSLALVVDVVMLQRSFIEAAARRRVNR